MKSLCIVKPLRLLQASNADAARLITPDPKEAITVPNNSTGVFYDFAFGQTTTFDSFYIGYHSAPVGSPAVAIMEHPNGIGGASLGALTGNMSLAPLGLGSPGHTFFQLATPVSTAYLRLRLNAASAGAISIGTFAVGKSWSAQWGQEMGAGRFIEDASTVERLFGGGFGIDEGAITGGYQWTFGDLQNDEIRTLYQTVKGLGTSRSLLVVEDPEQTDGLNERIHWGVLSKIEAYERVDPSNTKWGLSIRDWG